MKISNVGVCVRSLVSGLCGLGLLLSSPAQAEPPAEAPDLSTCASLPASRSDQFHGYPLDNDLSLFMAGNQFVVFDKVLEGFNAAIGSDPGDLTRDPKYYVELVPPGQEANQIISGCMLLGAENEDNFLPFAITTPADVFTSTNLNLMDRLAGEGFIYKTRKYIQNKLDLLVAVGNPAGIGTGGIADMALDLLDPTIRVSEVDHINEGIHRGINRMYQAMDLWVRQNGTSAEVAALDAALAAVIVPQPGSPAETRTIEEGITTDFNLATNGACHYADGNPDGIAPGTLRLCEFAILNKANTHETRVHHIETPARVAAGESDTGPLWVSEVIFAVNKGTEVEGIGIPEAVNAPVTYYVAVVDKTVQANHKQLAIDFVNFLRSPEGQAIYEAGGFIPLSAEDLAFETVYPENRQVIRVDPGAW